MGEVIARDEVLRSVPGDPGRTEAFLPTSRVQNHAAFLAALPGGDLGCVWFAGTQEGIPDVSILFSRLPGGAERWTEPAQLSDDPTRSEQNPLLFATPDGPLWLLWTAQTSGHQDTAMVRRRVSTDGGRSWGAVETLFPPQKGYGTFIRQPVVVLGNGDWLLPIWRCATPPAGAWTGHLDTSSVMVSSDRGASWAEHEVPDSAGMVHMAVVDLGAEGLLALYRSRWADFIHESRSRDGRRWTPPRPTALPNNNSSLALARLRSGALVLAYNHASAADATGRRRSLYDDIGGALEVVASGGREAFWGAPRAPMTLALSEDGGRTWPWRRNVAEGDGHCMTNNSRDRLNRELSYPSLLEAEGAVHLVFTWWRQAIRHVRVTEAWIREGREA